MTQGPTGRECWQAVCRSEETRRNNGGRQGEQRSNHPREARQDGQVEVGAHQSPKHKIQYFLEVIGKAYNLQRDGFKH